MPLVISSPSSNSSLWSGHCCAGYGRAALAVILIQAQNLWTCNWCTCHNHLGPWDTRVSDKGMVLVVTVSLTLGASLIRLVPLIAHFNDNLVQDSSRYSLPIFLVGRTRN
jgi:hypothetical protein